LAFVLGARFVGQQVPHVEQVAGVLAIERCHNFPAKRSAKEMTSPPQIVKNGRKRAEFTVALLLVSPSA